MNAIDENILTIGHSTHTFEAFVALLQRHRVSMLADVRSAPFSRYNPQFNRQPLARNLVARGIAYAFLGLELGGRSDDPSCYENGRICYDRISETELFQRGLERIVHDAIRHRIALMCAEKEPLACHRALLVARALEARGVAVEHILSDGRLETHFDAMDRLLAIYGDPQQGELFECRDQQIARTIARQAQRIARKDETEAARFVTQSA